MKTSERGFRIQSGLPFLLTFLIFTGALLWLRKPATVGITLLALCIVWDLLFFFWARGEQSATLRQILTFSMVLSVFQVLPDWVLSRHLGVLVFPPDGLFKWDTVSGYMALLWAIPASQILIAHYVAHERTGRKTAYAAGILVGAILFIGSEELLWMLPSWYAVNVVKWGHVARYIIIPEILLSFMIIFAFVKVRERALLWYVLAGLMVSGTYTLAAVMSYYLIG